MSDWEKREDWYSHPGDVVPEDLKGDHGLVDEPLWYLRGLSYSAYRKSEHWRRLRREFRDWAVQQGRFHCWRCGLKEIDEVAQVYVWYLDVFKIRCKKNSRKYPTEHRAVVWEKRLPQLDTHHRTYENLGVETFDDLELLCHPCHNMHHNPDSNAGRAWAYYLQQSHDYPYGRGVDPGSPNTVEGSEQHRAWFPTDDVPEPELVVEGAEVLWRIEEEDDDE